MSARRRRIDRVHPPSLCDWQLLAVVVIVTELALLLMMLGQRQWNGWTSFAYATAYAQILALACAGAVCITGTWFKRVPARYAWFGSWALVILVAISVSTIAGVVGTALLLGPESMPLSQFVMVSVLAAALVSAALLRYLFIHAQWRLQIVAQADARVQALQSRIRPHFLFNSLNTIASLIAEDQNAAERATEDLADLFRGSMKRADRPIPLAEELELARKYLAMEQRRLGGRVIVEWNTAELPEDVLVLPLTLQPLLENAVVHGVQPHPGQGRISVYGRAADGEIMITVQNSVPPEPGDTAGHGMALDNLHERLRLAYGDDAGLITRREDDAYYAVLRFPHDPNPDR